MRCLRHKYSTSCDVEILEDVKPKTTKTLDKREGEGLESGYQEERMGKTYLHLDKGVWVNVETYNCFRVSGVQCRLT